MAATRTGELGSALKDLVTRGQSGCAAWIIDRLLRGWTASRSRPSGAGAAVFLGCYYSLVSRGAALTLTDLAAPWQSCCATWIVDRLLRDSTASRSRL